MHYNGLSKQRGTNKPLESKIDMFQPLTVPFKENQKYMIFWQNKKQRSVSNATGTHNEWFDSRKIKKKCNQSPVLSKNE